MRGFVNRNGITEFVVLAVILMAMAIGESFAQVVGEPVGIPLDASGSQEQLPIKLSSLLAPIQCNDGALYFRRLEPDNPLAANLESVDLKEKVSTTFDLNRVPDLRGELRVTAFTVGTGHVFEAVTATDKGKEIQYIISFTKTGEFSSKLPVDGRLEIQQFAPLDNNRFFVIARFHVDKQNAKHWVGIVQPDGNLVSAEVSLPESKTQSIDSAAVIGSSDGRIYLATFDEDPGLYVLGSGGELQNKLKLPPSVTSLGLMDVFVSGSRILLLAQSSHEREQIGAKTRLKTRLVLMDSVSNSPIRVYRLSASTNGIPVCFDGRSLGFLVSRPTGFFGYTSADLN